MSAAADAAAAAADDDADVADVVSSTSNSSLLTAVVFCNGRIWRVRTIETFSLRTCRRADPWKSIGRAMDMV